MKKALITGSSGLVGSDVCVDFDRRGFEIHGVDNNQRAVFFGPSGDTRWNQRRLESRLQNFHHHELDMRNREGVVALVAELRPDVIVHTAAQPSHDVAATIPFDDFDTNAGGTLNLLEAVRRACPESPFIHMSTNKVYGDRPNAIPIKELETRWDYDDPTFQQGIGEDFPIDQCMHSIFGASKVASDIMVQEYGRYFQMPTCCLRGGCLTGPNHSGVELHGFLSYLVKCNLDGREYKVYGYKGKQVRDNLHSEDVAAFMYAFYQKPRIAEVYNLGGGKANSCSILEAFALTAEVTGKKQQYVYVDEARAGDHIVYYSDLRKMKSHFPEWEITKSLSQTLRKSSRLGRDGYHLTDGCDVSSGGCTLRSWQRPEMKTASNPKKSKTNAAVLDHRSAPVELQSLSPAILASYAIAMCVVAFTYSVITNHVWEDSMITLRLAENLVNGNGLTYHGGTRVHTFTSPINVLLLALCYLITGKGSYVATIWAYRVFSIAAFAGSGVLLIQAVAKATPRWSLALWWLAIAYMFDGKSVAFSSNGMETAFLLLFVAWAIYLISLSDPTRWLARGFCCAGLMWSRPDGCVYIAAFACAELLFSGINRKVLLSSFVRSAVVAAVVYGPWILWAWYYYGSPIPNTILAKNNPAGSIAAFWIAVDRFPEKTFLVANEVFRHIQSSFGFLLDNDTARRFSDLTTKFLGIACLIYWMFPVQDRLGKSASFCFTFLCLYFTYQATPMGWYYPPATMLGLATIARAATTLVISPVLASRRNLIRATAVALMIFTAVGQAAVFALTTAEMKIQQAEIETGTRTQVGLWLHDHGKPTDTVNLEPLGYIGYFSGMTMHDYPGLASPKVVQLRRDKLLDSATIIDELKTDWVVLRPYEYQLVLRSQIADSFSKQYELVKDFSAIPRLDQYSFLPRKGYIYFDATFIIFHRKSQPT